MNEHFLHLEQMNWAWIAVVIGGAILLGVIRQRAAVRRFADERLRKMMLPSATLFAQAVRGGAIMGALVLIVVALMDPRGTAGYINVPQQGADVIFVVDVSRSMLAEDVKPNRLGRAKQFIRDMVDKMAGERVGLIGFAGTATMYCPLTADYGAFNLSLEDLSPKTSARGGSLLGDAIRSAGNAFTDEVKGHKVVIVLTDGEDQESSPVEAAANVFETLGARIYTIGLGDSLDGARIPVEGKGGRTYLTYEGNEVWSKMNPKVLKDVALAGGGAYIPVGTGDADMGQVYEDVVRPAGGSEREEVKVPIQTPMFQWFLGPALGLLMLEWVMRWVKPARRDGMGVE